MGWRLRWFSLYLFLVGCGDQEGQYAEPPEVTGITPEETFSRVCSVCHGLKGEGKVEMNAPAIAGLPSWYVEEQIEKFRNGLRDDNPEDVAETLMKAISLSLTPEQIAGASEEIEQLPEILTSITDEGDVDRGRLLFAESCMPCHRFDGRGERAFHSSPLVTFNPEYLKKQLENYSKGRRGTKIEDYYGQKMYVSSTRLTGEDITNLVRYIGELAKGDDPRTVMEK